MTALFTSCAVNVSSLPALQVALMLVDALLLAEPHMPIHTRSSDALLLSQCAPPPAFWSDGGSPCALREYLPAPPRCGSVLDPDLDGFIQLGDHILPMIASAAAAAKANAPDSEEAEDLHEAALLIDRVHCRQLYRFVGSVILTPSEISPSWKTRKGLDQVAFEIANLAEQDSGESGISLEGVVLLFFHTRSLPCEGLVLIITQYYICW